MGRQVSLRNVQIKEAPAYADIAAGAQYRNIPVESLTVNPLNERPAGTDDEIAELAETMREHGAIQPLVACSKAAFLAKFPEQATSSGRLVDEGGRNARWVVLIGNRRLIAAQHAGLTELPVITDDERIGSMYTAMLIENLQRRDMPPLNEAQAMSHAMREESMSASGLARRIGKTPAFVSQRLALLKLIPELQAALAAGELKLEMARTLGELPAGEQRQIVAVGPPYRPLPLNGVKDHSARRGWSASPTVAADAIRKKFDAGELAELVRILSEHLEELGQRDRDG